MQNLRDGGDCGKVAVCTCTACPGTWSVCFSFAQQQVTFSVNRSLEQGSCTTSATVRHAKTVIQKQNCSSAYLIIYNCIYIYNIYIYIWHKFPNSKCMNGESRWVLKVQAFIKRGPWIMMPQATSLGRCITSAALVNNVEPAAQCHCH